MSAGIAADRVRGSLSDRVARRLFFVGLFILVTIVLATFKDYGITWDEDIQSRYGQTLIRWYATLGQDDAATRFGNLYLYGGFFETLAETLARRSPLGLFETRHLVGALFGMLAFVAAYGTGVRLSGPIAGLCAAALLALDPLFYGHLFANPKDSPFAAVFMVAVYFMVLSAMEIAAGRKPRVLGLGLSIGLCAGIRVWGLGLLFWLAVLWAASFLRSRRQAVQGPPARRLIASFLGITAMAWTVMTLAWPWAMQSPLIRPFHALFATASLRPDVKFLFRGEIVEAAMLPRDYALTWLAITLPEAHWICLLIGVLLAVAWTVRRGWRNDSETSLRVLLIGWLILIVVSPLLLVAAARPFLYDGIRHLLFIIPPLCVLCGVALAECLRASVGLWFKGAAAGAVLISVVLTVVEMIQLHPYQTVYFNRLFGGGLQTASANYETDYWGSTYREGALWLARNYRSPSREPIRVSLLGATRQVSEPLAQTPEGKRFVVREDETDPNILLITRNRDRFRRIKGTLLHTVDRQGTPLLYIFEIKAPSPLAPDETSR